MAVTGSEFRYTPLLRLAGEMQDIQNQDQQEQFAAAIASIRKSGGVGYVRKVLCSTPILMTSLVYGCWGRKGCGNRTELVYRHLFLDHVMYTLALCQNRVLSCDYFFINFVISFTRIAELYS